MTRAEVERMLGAGLGVSDIARLLGVCKSTVVFHKRRLGQPIETKYARRHDWEEIQEYYDAGHSKRECQERFGFSSQTWHKAMQRGAIITRPQATPIRELLVAGRKRTRSHVKRRLIGAGLKEDRCEACGLLEWRGRPLAFELHHVNGDGLDNRLMNLRILCPNCHSQTPTWGGRNNKRKRPTSARG